MTVKTENEARTQLKLNKDEFLNVNWLTVPAFSKKKICVSSSGEYFPKLVQFEGATVVLMRMPEVQKSTNVEQPKMPILCIQLGLTKINKSDMKELKFVCEQQDYLGIKWPSPDQLLRCVKCNKSVVADNRTIYLMAAQYINGFAGMYEDTLLMVQRVMPRFFCVSCLRPAIKNNFEVVEEIIKQLSEEPNTSAAGLWAHSDDIGMLDAIGHMLEQELEGSAEMKIRFLNPGNACFNTSCQDQTMSMAKAALDRNYLKLCAKCRTAKYCCRDCQVQDFKFGRHKQICQAVQDLEAEEKAKAKEKVKEPEPAPNAPQEGREVERKPSPTFKKLEEDDDID